MHTVLTSIAIDAPKERVWAALTDFAAYDDWNPILSELKGKAAVGEIVKFKLQNGPVKLPIDAKVVKANGEELCWRGPASATLAKVVCGHHFFRIEAREEGVRFVHGETFAGLGIKQLWPKLEPQLRESYEKFNVALKKRCEL